MVIRQYGQVRLLASLTQPMSTSPWPTLLLAQTRTEMVTIPGTAPSTILEEPLGWLPSDISSRRLPAKARWCLGCGARWPRPACRSPSLRRSLPPLLVLLADLKGFDVALSARRKELLGGGDDQGQRAERCLLMQRGLFGVRGGTAQQLTDQVTTPLFEKITPPLPDNNDPAEESVIEAADASVENRYVPSPTLDGEPLQKPWFYHGEVVNGGHLQLEVGSTPNEEWGSDPSAAPPSMSTQ